ncbi:MAG: B12-binding domain-containing protein, partial [Anaerolineales bacterium]
MSTILEQISAAVFAGDAEKTGSLVQKAVDENITAKDILDNGLVLGMGEVGARFKRGEMFVPEVLMSAEAMHTGLELLRPLLAESDATRIGKIMLATVKGDLHDIGKNLVGMMCEGDGFEVVDLGFNVGPDVIVEKIKEHQP